MEKIFVTKSFKKFYLPFLSMQAKMFHKKPCNDEEQNDKYENCVANIFTVHSQNCNEGEYQSSHMVM